MVDRFTVTAKEVGRVMRDARRFRGLSQREVADRMGVNQATLSRYEHGESTPNVIEWFVFCSVTQIFPDLPWSNKEYCRLCSGNKENEVTEDIKQG